MTHSTRALKCLGEALGKDADDFAYLPECDGCSTAAPIGATIVDALELFMQRNRANGFTKKTLEFYRCQLEPLQRHLTASGIVHVHSVQPKHLWSYLSTLAERGLKDTSIHAAARAMRTFFNFCTAQHLIAQSPMAKVDMPRLARRIHPSFPRQSLPRLISACRGKRDKAIVLFLLDTGCRASELLNLRWRDVDLATGRVVIRGGKGRKDRVVFIGRGTREVLDAYRVERKALPGTDRPIWLSYLARKPLTASGLRQLLERLGKRAGIEHCAPHTFRRTFAIESLRKGIDLYTLARLMGHADIAVLRVYLDILEEDLLTAQHRFGVVDGLLPSDDE